MIRGHADCDEVHVKDPVTPRIADAKEGKNAVLEMAEPQRSEDPQQDKKRRPA
jgi:hypothetical protein